MDEDEDWFAGWVKLHCVSTAAGPDAARALLANRDNFVDLWRATPGELGEVTFRLRGSFRTPKFASDHADAVGLELVRLREERALAGRVAPNGDFAPSCEACGGSGLATIPVRACVWEGRLVLHREYGKVLTGAVLCDRPGCLAGQAAREKESAAKGRPPRPTLSACCRQAGCDLVALLRGHERDLARRARESGASGAEDWGRTLASVEAKARAA
jgi:hypothetical protein